MSSLDGIATEDVENIRFIASDDLNPLVQVTKRGSTVTREGAGLYRIDLPAQNQCDPDDRIVHVSVTAAGVPSIAVERIPATDQIVRVGNTDLAGVPTDSGDAINVSVKRARNH